MFYAELCRKIETNDIRNRKILKITTGRFFNETDRFGKAAGGYVAERESRSDASDLSNVSPSFLMFVFLDVVLPDFSIII